MSTSLSPYGARTWSRPRLIERVCPIEEQQAFTCSPAGRSENEPSLKQQSGRHNVTNEQPLVCYQRRPSGL